MTLDEYISQRYGPAIDQVREMDEGLANAIRWGVIAGIGVNLATHANAPGLETMTIQFNRESPMAFFHGAAFYNRMELMPSATPQDIFHRIAHLIEAEVA